MKVEKCIRIRICVTAEFRFLNFRSSRLRGFFLTTSMKECHGGRPDGAERPGFSIVEMLFIHLLCSRRETLSVPHISSALRRGGLRHLVRSEQIWRRAPQITQWQDVRYHHDLARPRLYAFESCGVPWSPREHEVNSLLTTYGPQLLWPTARGWPVDQLWLHLLVGTILHPASQDAQTYNL